MAIKGFIIVVKLRFSPFGDPTSAALINMYAVEPMSIFHAGEVPSSTPGMVHWGLWLRAIRPGSAFPISKNGNNPLNNSMEEQAFNVSWTLLRPMIEDDTIRSIYADTTSAAATTLISLAYEKGYPISVITPAPPRATDMTTVYQYHPHRD